MATLSNLSARIIRRTQLRSGASTPPTALPVSNPPRSDPPPPQPGGLAEEPGSARVTQVAAPPPEAGVDALRDGSGIHVVDHAAAQHALALLCNRQTSHYAFRSTCRQLLTVLTLEAMRNTPTAPVTLELDARRWSGAMLDKSVVLLAVNRDGLGLSHNLMECVPGLIVGSISLERIGAAAPQARLHLASTPALSDCRVILFDPVIQSGTAANVALNLVRHSGATDVSLVNFCASAAGLARLQSTLPTLRVWTAHVDREWDPKRTPAGLLGDFGARLFG